MITKKKVFGLTVVIVLVVASGAHALRVRDAEIQSERDLSARLIKAYEQKVKKADAELRELESQTIAFTDLETISNLQTRILNTSKLLISLAPVLKNPEKVDKSSQANVDLFNKHVRAFNDNIGEYQSQMSELNRIVDRANKQYVIKVIKPSFLDRSSLSSRRKFFEIISLSPTPKLVPSSLVEEINKGISERSNKQRSMRTLWNTKAKIINNTNRDINSNLIEIYRLYKTSQGGIRIEKAIDVKVVG
jgi:hypothetical protein